MICFLKISQSMKLCSCSFGVLYCLCKWFPDPDTSVKPVAIAATIPFLTSKCAKSASCKRRALMNVPLCSKEKQEQCGLTRPAGSSPRAAAKRGARGENRSARQVRHSKRQLTGHVVSHRLMFQSWCPEGSKVSPLESSVSSGFSGVY